MTLSLSARNTDGSVCSKDAALDQNFVQHSYRDYALDSSPPYRYSISRDITFPTRLYSMLEQVEQDEFAHIIAWQPHGRCFVIHKPEALESILSRYFKITMWSSFQRQLNLYGFKRMTQGLDKGGYYHEKFLRGRDFLATQIYRMRIKGTGPRAKANPEQEPKFWSMPWVQPEAPADSSPVPATEFSPCNSINMLRNVSDNSIRDLGKKRSSPCSNLPAKNWQAPTQSLTDHLMPTHHPFPTGTLGGCEDHGTIELSPGQTSALSRNLDVLAQNMDSESLDFFVGMFQGTKVQEQVHDEDMVSVNIFD